MGTTLESPVHQGDHTGEWQWTQSGAALTMLFKVQLETHSSNFHPFNDA